MIYHQKLVTTNERYHQEMPRRQTGVFLGSTTIPNQPRRPHRNSPYEHQPGNATTEQRTTVSVLFIWRNHNKYTMEGRSGTSTETTTYRTLHVRCVQGHALSDIPYP